MVCEMRPVYPRVWICSQRVCDEVSVGCLNDEYSRVGAHEEGDI